MERTASRHLGGSGLQAFGSFADSMLSMYDDLRSKHWKSMEMTRDLVYHLAASQKTRDDEGLANLGYFFSHRTFLQSFRAVPVHRPGQDQAP